LRPTRSLPLHGDDTTVPVIAKGKTDTGRIWVYVRDNYSRDQTGKHPRAHSTSSNLGGGATNADGLGCKS